VVVVVVVVGVVVFVALTPDTAAIFVSAAVTMTGKDLTNCRILHVSRNFLLHKHYAYILLCFVTGLIYVTIIKYY